jgi:hypothetical protein
MKKLSGLVKKLRKAKVKRLTWNREPSILLHPPIPPPMYGLAPRNIMGARWWYETRQASYRSTDYHCQACGVHRDYAEVHRWLEGHEFYTINYLTGRMIYRRTTPLCHYCHNFIHIMRLGSLVEKGKVPIAKYNAVVAHGNAILKQAGLVKPPVYNGRIAPWHKWRLIFNRKHYKPLYSSLDEWNLHHNDDWG